MIHERTLPILSCLATLALLLPAAAATAAPAATSDLLLPWFEVQVDGPGPTTLLAVVNTSTREVPVQVGVFTNWGVEVLRVPLVLAPEAVQSINLRDWLVLGTLPQGQALDAAELAHVTAALCGERSPKDGLAYASVVLERRAVGYVTIRALDRRDDALVGDFLIVDPAAGSAQGEALVDVDPAAACGSGLCRRHALRFLEGGGFDGSTELIVWTASRLAPGAGPLAAQAAVELAATAYDEPGDPLGERRLGLLPVQVLRVDELDLAASFGWLDLVTEEPSWVGVRYGAGSVYSAALATACLPLQVERPRLEIEKYTNGADADAAPGVHVEPGGKVVWEYRVANTGSQPLFDVAVEDDDPSLRVSCSKDSLDVGESMLCTAEGVAGRCGYRNVGTARGVTADGAAVADDDASHYFAGVPAALDLRVTVNGDDAEFPGPHVAPGTPLTFRWIVTNTGVSDLTGVTVNDDAGASVACPRDALAAGESMTCTTFGVAAGEGGRMAGRAEARGECGEGVAADDEAWFQCGLCVEEPPSIHLEKATNGHDADLAPGPEIAPGAVVAWTYVVTNDGASPLHDVAVADDDPALTVSCPKSSLAPGESMTCTAAGTAGEGPYVNVGLATAKSACDRAVLDTDPSHYHNTPPEPPEPPVGDQGCTPGYWKNHTGSWPAAGQAPGQTVQGVFAAAGSYPQGMASLLDALGFGGGGGVEGGVRILLRASVAALLNAGHPGVAYPRSEASVIADVGAALAGGDRDAMIALAGALDADNNGGCPLN